jgi:methylated-DNA-[protein]-cysteine S-methyltransferase
MKEIFYTLRSSPFGRLSIVWVNLGEEPKVCRVFLPHDHVPIEQQVQRYYPDSRVLSCSAIEGLGSQIDGFLAGEAIGFELDLIHLDMCSPFQRLVLLAEHRIPRGWVSTYGRIAKSLGIPRGARAVGRALSGNPFPIIIPCHRAIRSDGCPGGFQGGLEMKRALLELEGIKVSPTGKVLTNKIYY